MDFGEMWECIDSLKADVSKLRHEVRMLTWFVGGASVVLALTVAIVNTLG